MLQDLGLALSMLSSEGPVTLLEAVLAGRFAGSGHLMANGVGTILWLLVIGALVGEVGELELGLELIELLD